MGNDVYLTTKGFALLYIGDLNTLVHFEDDCEVFKNS